MFTMTAPPDFKGPVIFFLFYKKKFRNNEHCCWYLKLCWDAQNFRFLKTRVTFLTPSLVLHSSEKRGLRSTFCPRETLQNLLYFMHKKTHVVFFVFHFVQLWVFPYECPGLCRHRPWHSLGKVARNEKRKKLHGFSYA